MHTCACQSRVARGGCSRFGRSCLSAQFRENNRPVFPSTRPAASTRPQTSPGHLWPRTWVTVSWKAESPGEMAPSCAWRTRESVRGLCPPPPSRAGAPQLRPSARRIAPCCRRGDPFRRRRRRTGAGRASSETGRPTPARAPRPHSSPSPRSRASCWTRAASAGAGASPWGWSARRSAPACCPGGWGATLAPLGWTATAWNPG